MTVSPSPKGQEPPPIRLLPHQMCLFSGDNHDREQQIDPEFEASIRDEGQKLPAISCPDLVLPDHFRTLDGNRRLAVVRRLDRPLLSYVLDRPATRAEAIHLKLTLNVLRKQMTLRQIAQDAAIYIEETGCTQALAAQRLKVSEVTISRGLSLDMLDPADLAAMEQAKVPYSTIAVIAALSPREMQRQAMAFVLGDGSGKIQSRAMLELYVKRNLKKEKKKGRRAKSLRGTFEGRAFEIALTDKDDAARIAEWMKSVAQKIARRGSDIGVEGLPFLFK